jgi:hypothetical protein
MSVTDGIQFIAMGFALLLCGAQSIRTARYATRVQLFRPWLLWSRYSSSPKTVERLPYYVFGATGVIIGFCSIFVGTILVFFRQDLFRILFPLK